MIKLVNGERVNDGAGVSLNRVIGTNTLDNADPFLLLDEFRSDNKEDYIAGFPMHPHRGFETITYMIEGKFTHRDSKGNVGYLKSGEVQWMTAGRGIIHEEMPSMDNRHLWGYQLWINLPSKLKMIEPKYRHLTESEMPIIDNSGVKVKIISGSYNNNEGPIELYFPVDYFDVRINNGIFVKELKGTNLIYVHTGKVTVIADEELEIEAGNLCVITEYNKVQVKGDNSGFLFMSSEPLKEPIKRYGPFVMNTIDEIIQAVDDNTQGLLDR
jgi:redox-sensitive bicupin YhaK (pirin superfamily)